MIKKEITFIYSDSAEKAIMEPILKEADKRGYKTKLSMDKFEKCEIGVYCQHINHPQYSKLSIIMLHDIIQQYSNWPDIWYCEPWNKYDIGILPSNKWVENWKQCSDVFYSRPKMGIYKVGWPKADLVKEIKNSINKESVFNEFGFDINRKTILYAPAWENDNKQDDFVKSMSNLNVNILIKQWDAPKEKFPKIVDNIKKMEELHKNIEGVYILPPSTNIFYAISLADVLVSEESSTMAEATMLGVPSVSVSDWLIPDVEPSRYPKCDYDFVTMTTKANLKNTIQCIINDYDNVHKRTQDIANINFPNIGKSSEIIMDIIDDAINNKSISYEALCPDKKKRIKLKKYLRHKALQFKLEVYDNYRERYALVRMIWNILSKLKH